jgi:hypothetical protein
MSDAEANLVAESLLLAEVSFWYTVLILLAGESISDDQSNVLGDNLSKGIKTWIICGLQQSGREYKKSGDGSASGQLLCVCVYLEGKKFLEKEINLYDQISE